MLLPGKFCPVNLIFSLFNKGPPEARWCMETGMSFWPSVTVCSLIRPGNSIGPRSEGEQRYQMDIGRGVKKKWNGQTYGEVEQQKMHTHPCTNITTVSRPWKTSQPTHPQPCTNPIKFLQYDLLRIRIKCYQTAIKLNLCCLLKKRVISCHKAS